MTECNTTSGDVSAARVARALQDAIAYREKERVRLRDEKIASYKTPRKLFGFIDLPALSDEDAVKRADKNLTEMLGTNATYYSHGYHIREMGKILSLAQAVARTPGATMRMSVEDFQYVTSRYNNEEY